MSIRVLENNNKDLQWIDITKPTHEDRQHLQNLFKFITERDVSEAWGNTERSKLVKREQYIYLDLLVPLYNKKTRSITIDEIDFFIGKHFVITVHQGTLPPIAGLYERCTKDEHERHRLLESNSEYLLSQLLSKLLEFTYPTIDDINDELDKLKKTIFSDNNNSREIVKDILITRRNITDLRKAMRGHAPIVSHILKHEHHERPVFYIKHHLHFNEIIDYSNEIWEALESYKEIIEALEDANESMVSHTLNDIMKTLTLFSVVLLPASVLAGIFGMNAYRIPLQEHPLGFWGLIAIIMGVSGIMFWIIWRKWLR